MVLRDRTDQMRKKLRDLAHIRLCKTGLQGLKVLDHDVQTGLLEVLSVIEMGRCKGVENIIDAGVFLQEVILHLANQPRASVGIRKP